MSGIIGPMRVQFAFLAVVLASVASPAQAHMTATQRRAHENYKRFFGSSDHSYTLGTYHTSKESAGRHAHSHQAQAKKHAQGVAERAAHKRAAARVQSKRHETARQLRGDRSEHFWMLKR
mmetsp:Transcript_68138/g.127232  ORF Transcript_68138/g.127232 Transcript_68138/m.127232 type:complete len:120 (+) Transcript_68138:104-463(+)